MKEVRPPVLKIIVCLLFLIHLLTILYMYITGHTVILCSHVPLLSLLALIFASKNNPSSIFIKLKQAFIKNLNTDKDGIWSGPLPGNFPAE